MTALKNESGRTMLEMLGVLAIMGVIVYGAIAGIGFGIEVYKVNASYTDLEELSQGIIDLYSWSDSYENLTCKVLADNDVLSIAISGTAAPCIINGRYGGYTVIGTAQEFTISYDGLTTLACNRLKGMDYTNLDLDGLQCGDDGTGGHVLRLKSR